MNRPGIRTRYRIRLCTDIIMPRPRQASEWLLMWKLAARAAAGSETFGKGLDLSGYVVPVTR